MQRTCAFVCVCGRERENFLTYLQIPTLVQAKVPAGKPAVLDAVPDWERSRAPTARSFQLYVISLDGLG